MKSAVAHELAPASPVCGLEAPGEQCLSQLPTDERVFVEVQVSSGDVPAHHAVGAKKSSLDALESVTGPVSCYLHYPSPKVVQLSAKKDILSCCAFSWEVGGQGVRLCV